MKFTLYSLDTGRVLFGGESDSPDSLAQVGQAVLPDKEYTDGWIKDGQHYAQTVATNPNHVWNWDTKQWSDPRTLQDLKDARNRYIKDSRLKANKTSFAYLDQRIAVDEVSRGDIETTNGVVLLTGEMPPDWVGGWKTVANTYVPIPDVATWKQFYLAMNAQGSINFAHAQELKKKLASATTVEQVEAVIW